ncbi:MAG: hypothetical protein D6808_00475 [Candidatus Dadabacteria bacterium]|nr:MAG: hypothetical protein D6808_00475 [Candidatus Dadabacteria bacterium]
MSNEKGFEGNTELHTIETTLGELIEAIISIAQQAGRSEDESYYLTSVVLNELLFPNAVFESQDEAKTP